LNIVHVCANVKHRCAPFQNESIHRLETTFVLPIKLVDLLYIKFKMNNTKPTWGNKSCFTFSV